MKIPTQKIQICVGIFLQHYTFLQKRTFSILCENFSRFVRKATVDSYVNINRNKTAAITPMTIPIIVFLAFLLLMISKKYLTAVVIYLPPAVPNNSFLYSGAIICK